MNGRWTVDNIATKKKVNSKFRAGECAVAKKRIFFDGKE
jgi:hypothetical protein